MKLRDYIVNDGFVNGANSWNAAIDAAVKACDEEAKDTTDEVYLDACESCAEKIRRLKK